MHPAREVLSRIRLVAFDIDGTLTDGIARAFSASRVEVARGPLAPSQHEPAAMALIALRTLHRLPSGLPAVTGATHAAILGHVHTPS